MSARNNAASSDKYASEPSTLDLSAAEILSLQHLMSEITNTPSKKRLSQDYTGDTAARRAILIMRRQLDPSRESYDRSRSVVAKMNDLHRTVDGSLDQTPQLGTERDLPVVHDVVSGITRAAKPLYDAADSIEDTIEFSSANAPHFWSPSSSHGARQVLENTTSAIAQPVKILYDVSDSEGEIEKAATTSPAKYWHPEKTDVPALQKVGKSMVSQLPVKIVYDVADAVTDPVSFMNTSLTTYWAPAKSRAAGQSTKQGEPIKNTTLADSPTKGVVLSTNRAPDSVVQDRVTAPQGPSPALPTTPRRPDCLQDGQVPADTHETKPRPVPSRAADLKEDRSRDTEDNALPVWRPQSGQVSPIQIFIQQPAPRERRSTQSSIVQSDQSLSSYERVGRHSTQTPAQHRRHQDRSRARSSNNKAYPDSTSRIASGQSRRRASRGHDSVSSLQLATQSLDRALISLNGLLDEAMSMINHATASGRHGEVINIINATNDSFRTAKVSRPGKMHVRRRLITKPQDGSSSSSLSEGANIRSSKVSFKPAQIQSLRTYGDDVAATIATLQAMPSNDTMIVHPSATPLRVSSSTARASTSSTRSPRSHPAVAQWNAHARPGSREDHVVLAPNGRISDETGFIIEHADLKHPPRPHVSVASGDGLQLGFRHKQRPIARNWSPLRKRITAIIACCNTVFVGLLAGIYAGEVPAIQYQIADLDHRVVLGNVLLYLGMAVTTMLFWPLPLLHGRKPYTVAAFAIMLPLQYPQALAVQAFHDPGSIIARVGLLLPRAVTGLAMGFANINFLPTLLDLYGASLMSDNPHQEHVQLDDVRRQGGGIGLWLGIWSWCYIGSLAIGFCIGACIISSLNLDWGFYLTIILLAVFLLVNIVAPETRQAPYRHSVIHIFDHEYVLKRRVAKGEVHLHLYMIGPRWWFEEVWAGMVLSSKMLFQAGFFVMNLYFAWIYAQVVLVILLLGALLSRYYVWSSDLVGLASLSLALGALFAVPLSHGNVFSRSRTHSPRTDSMTFHHGGIKWTSHMVRRIIFTLVLPLAGLAYTLGSRGPCVTWIVPVVFVGLIGFVSNLAMTECIGLIMETFDTCDLQAGVNKRHREKSLPDNVQKARTHYSAFPRVCAGFFASQSLGFMLAAAATAVAGTVTRSLGAQLSTAGVAGILLVLTVLLLLVLLRWHSVQVVPDDLILAARRPKLGTETEALAADWRPVVLGNPSGKARRMNLLETGKMSRWSEIRRLNGLDTL